MKIVVGGIKGGSGKTTIATNLTVMRSLDGKKVLLVDADEQKSSTDWASQRDCMSIKTNWSTIQLSGKSIYSQLQRISQDYDDIIIDVGGRDTTSQRSALICADIFLIPFKPRSLDIWTIGSLKKMIEEVSSVNPSLKSIAIVNQADARGSDNLEALEIIAKSPELTCIQGSIGNRKSFCNAAAEGLGIIELKNKDMKAMEEMNVLYKYIFG
jgi:chromosome partitioning protein